MIRHLQNHVHHVGREFWTDMRRWWKSWRMGDSLGLEEGPWGSRPLMITDPLWKVGRRKCLGLNVSYCLQCPTLGHSLCFLNDTWWTSFKNRQGLCSSSIFKMQIALVFQLTLSHQWFMSALEGQNNKKKSCWMEKEWETPFRTQDIFYPSFWPHLYLYYIYSIVNRQELK